MMDDKINRNQRLMPPTGNETSLEAIARKRAIAKSLMESGLKGPGPDARSWTQVLGSLAQAWVGKSMEKEADKKATALRELELTNFRAKDSRITDMMRDVPGNMADILAFSSDPYFQDDPRVKAVAEALAKREAARYNFSTDPKAITGPGGQAQLAVMNPLGEAKVLDGMTPREKGEIADNGAFINPHDPKNIGQNFLNPNNYITFGPDGLPKINEDYVGAKSRVAAAGAPTTTVGVYEKAEAKSFGDEIPEAIVTELSKNRELGSQFQTALPSLQRAKQLLEKGIYAGAFGQTKLDLARVGKALGLTGKDTNELIANTQGFMINIARQMFPFLKELRPASDSDRQVAERMAAGDLSLDPKAIMSAVNAMIEEGNKLTQRHNRRVDEVGVIFGTDNPNVGKGLRAFRIGDPSPQEETPAQRARRILQERRSRGGAGSGQRNFPAGG